MFILSGGAGRAPASTARARPGRERAVSVGGEREGGGTDNAYVMRGFAGGGGGGGAV
jgi:hypothetical protein